MKKKYLVRLTEEERAICEATIKKEKGKSEKLRRASIMLKADADDCTVIAMEFVRSKKKAGEVSGEFRAVTAQDMDG